MTIQQLYYTSYESPRMSGFQVKAASPDIPPVVQALILDLKDYSIPIERDERFPRTHPVALRYRYAGPRASVLLCAQSNGPDENGRAGNYFAHALVVPPHLFGDVPPISFWGSPFWRTRHSSPSTDLPELPDLAAVPVTLPLTAVWAFLGGQNRRALLYKLLCAVVQSQGSGRRIVIVDEASHVALWIAAVSALLPPSYRLRLNFATYHHDPYQVQHLLTIVGTPPDARFAALPEEYGTFFILNAVEGRVSGVADSPYARLAASCAASFRYERCLLPFFTRYEHRFPPIDGVDGRQLERMQAAAAEERWR
jgi:hypothetical protein